MEALGTIRPAKQPWRTITFCRILIARLRAASIYAGKVSTRSLPGCSFVAQLLS